MSSSEGSNGSSQSVSLRKSCPISAPLKRGLLVNECLRGQGYQTAGEGGEVESVLRRLGRGLRRRVMGLLAHW